MKKIFFILTILAVHLQSASLKELWQKYDEKKYDEVCSNSVSSKEYYRYNYDENFINMFAYSCLQTDMINRLAVPITQLRKTKESRANALYFATVLYQKKLLHHALVDGLDTFPTGLPTTKYILSKIYDKFTKKEYNKKDNKYIFKDEGTPYTYELYTRYDSDGFTKLVLKTFENGTVIKTRLYW